MSEMVMIFAKQPNHGRKHIRYYRLIKRMMLVKLCYTNKDIKTEVIRVTGDPVSIEGKSGHKISTIYFSYGALHLGWLVLADWGVEPYEIGEFEETRWLEKAGLWDSIRWFFKTARAPVSFDN